MHVKLEVEYKKRVHSTVLLAKYAENSYRDTHRDYEEQMHR